MVNLWQLVTSRSATPEEQSTTLWEHLTGGSAEGDVSGQTLWDRVRSRSSLSHDSSATFWDHLNNQLLDPAVAYPGGGGASRKRRSYSNQPSLIDKLNHQQILREDEEILAVIMAAVELM